MEAISTKPNPDKSPAGNQRQKSLAVVVPHAPRWRQRLGAWLVFALMRGLAGKYSPGAG